MTVNPINDSPVLSLDNPTSFSLTDRNSRTFSVDVNDIDIEDS